MQRMRFELGNLNRQLDWIIDHAIKQSEKHGDGWDQICDDVTDAREKILNALKVTNGEKQI